MGLRKLYRLIKAESKKGVNVEGSATTVELKYLKKLAANDDIKLIAEIGFNAGYSSYNFLAANSKNRVVSFDIGEHAYLKIGRQYINKKFPGRLHLVLGDSQKTVPEYAAENPTVKFDLIFIDGGHDYEVAKADIMNMKLLAHKDTILVVDDIMPWEPWGVGPTKAWEEALKKGHVSQTELVKDEQVVTDIKPPGERAWVTGRYLLKK